MRLLLAILALVILTAPAAHAEKRVALVIGNVAYRNVAPLINPRSDANDIAASLTRLNFSVNKLIDGTFDDMRHALLQFGRDAIGADMAVIYYSGHGMEIGGENWLIPVDAELLSDSDAESEAIPLKSAMLQAAHGSSLGLVILDACRNNPFAAKMQRSARYRSVDRGLVRVEPSDNVLVAYAAREGTVASDGDGKHSPFTEALLNNLETPGLEINFLFRTVRDEVMAATKREQQPFVYGSLSKQAIYLKEPLAKVQEPSPSSSTELTTIERAWALTQGTNSQAVLEAFIKRYGDSFYGDLARMRLKQVAPDAGAGTPETISPQTMSQQITFAEGLTSEQIVQRILDSDVLTGNIREIPREGSLLPQTYNVVRGNTREELIQLMRKDERRIVQEIWDHRAPDLPLKSPEQLVTLASIVEKETGRPDERSRVAAVFINRLKQRMRLQSDPTIIYGLVGGKGSLGRPLMKSEIEQPTPYNTYVIDGLPPGPIANPGRASLEATANPALTKELYFVPDGNGGHVFSETLEQHQHNVARLRGIEQGKANTPR
jgi:uncharacterized caspase-like protein